jgi:BirA family transcriptional regulator, biotin operon repressor / biotin---[acetyl-CoA-carboxylase] ligase
MRFTDRLVTLESTPSTMLAARERAQAAAPHGTTVVAREQTQGRGRLGRAWLSRRDAGLFMTTILRPRLGGNPARAGELAIVAGVAVLRAVHTAGVTSAKLKWPNDVLVGGRKLAGILLEADRLTTDPVVLVGIGVNLAPATSLSLPEELRGLYTGLAEHTAPSAAALPPFRDEVLAELEACYDRWAREGLPALVPEWNAHDALRGRQVRIDGPEPVVGVADGVNEHGELRVLTESGVKLVRSGEVIA